MTRGRLAVVFVLGMALLLPRPGVARAAPSAASVQAGIDSLSTEIASLDEDYNVARIRQTKVEVQVRDLTRRSAEAQARLKALRDVASRRAADVYQLGVPSFAVALLTSKDPTEASRKLALLSKVDQWEAGLVSDLTIARQRAEQAGEDLQRTLDQARSVAKTIDDRRQDLEDRLAKQQDLLKQIRAIQPPKPPPLPVKIPVSAPVLPSLSLAPAAQSAKAAVAAAYALLGKPYHYGAGGPDSFDCSGFTRFTWRSAGVALPHSSRAQYASLPHVPTDQLQPGDLVFFGNPIHHVGMYVGGGQMIHAPETGSTVEVSSMSRRDFVGAARPG
jgi:cell wall-associated NlpC family hydrolase